MKTIKPAAFVMSLATMAIMSSASAAVVETNPGVEYGAVLTTTNAANGGSLQLSIDASVRNLIDPPGSANANLKYATELDQIKFTMKRLTSVTMTGASSGTIGDWTYYFDNNSGNSSDFAYFTAVNNNHTGLSNPLTFDFSFLGTNLDFDNIRVDATYLTSTPNNFLGYTYYVKDHYTDSTLLDVTTRDLPEPASIALLGLGILGMGALRRRKAN